MATDEWGTPYNDFWKVIPANDSLEAKKLADFAKEQLQHEVTDWQKSLISKVLEAKAGVPVKDSNGNVIGVAKSDPGQDGLMVSGSVSNKWANSVDFVTKYGGGPMKFTDMQKYSEADASYAKKMYVSWLNPEDKKEKDDMSMQQIKVIASKMCDWNQKTFPPRLEFGLEIPHLESNGPKVTPCSACLSTATHLFNNGYLNVKVDPSMKPVKPNNETLLNLNVSCDDGKPLPLDEMPKSFQDLLLDIEDFFHQVVGSGCLVETVWQESELLYLTKPNPQGFLTTLGTKLIASLNLQLAKKHQRKVTKICYVRDNDGTIRIDVQADKKMSHSGLNPIF